MVYRFWRQVQLEKEIGTMDAAAVPLASATAGGEVEELIYTSSQKLLQPAASHLGVVAATENFSPEVQRQLGSLWSYDVPRELNLPESQQVPRFVLLPIQGQKNLTSLSRIQSAGFDHTGRTNPIAHHLVADCDSRAKDGLSVADLVVWASGHYGDATGPVFCERWVGEPEYLPRRALRGLDQQHSPFELLAAIPTGTGLDLEALKQGVLVAADVIREYRQQQRMVVCVIRPALAPYILGFVAAILSALPRRLQSGVSAISHVWEISDAPFGYALSFTYPRSPYLERVKTRVDAKKPAIIDLAARPCVIPLSTGEYVTYLERDHTHWTSRTNPPIPKLFDNIDPVMQQPAAVYKLKAALEDRRRNLTFAALREVALRARTCLRSDMPDTEVKSLASLVGRDSIQKFIAGTHWPELFETCSDPEIFRFVREYAWTQVAKQFSLREVALNARLCIESGLSEIKVAVLVNFVGQDSIQKFIAGAQWPELFETCTNPEIPLALREYAWTQVAEHLPDILRDAGRLAFKKACEPTGTNLLEMFKKQEHLIEVVFGNVEHITSDLSESELAAAALKWAELGTPVLRSAWRCLLDRLKRDDKVPVFCRQILDVLIPHAVVNLEQLSTGRSGIEDESFELKNDEGGSDNSTSPHERQSGGQR